MGEINGAKREALRILICDDERRMLSMIAEKVSACLPGSDIRVFASGSELLTFLQTEGCDIRALHQSMRRLKHDMKNHLMVRC